jgi:hypothetical protein
MFSPDTLHDETPGRSVSCFAGAATASIAVSLNPSSSELFSVEIVDEEVCGRVEADQKMGHSGDDVDGWNFCDCAIVT